MPSTSSLFAYAALAALARAHGVVTFAQGEAGSPNSVGFQVNPALARNCTSISPCQQDTTLIRDAEIKANIVNECGRTELSGNIDIGENTENAIAAGAVTQVKAGTRMTVTIHQVNADGAGPYACDLVSAGNNGQITANLTIENNVPGANGLSQAKTQDFNMTVIMPDSFPACTGSSLGNVCTVRCRNNAQAGPFGGCFPVQQIDTTASVNVASNVQTAATLDAVNKQVIQNQKDLQAAVDHNNAVGAADAQANAAAVTKLLGISIASNTFPTLTPGVVNNAAAATTTTAAAAATSAASGKKAKGQGKNNNKRSIRFGRRSD